MVYPGQAAFRNKFPLDNYVDSNALNLQRKWIVFQVLHEELTPGIQIINLVLDGPSGC